MPGLPRERISKWSLLFSPTYANDSLVLIGLVSSAHGVAMNLGSATTVEE